MTQRREDAENRNEQTPPPMPLMMGRGGPPGMRLMGEPVRAQDVRGTLRRLWTYLRRQWVALSLTTLMVTVTTAFTLLGPYLLATAIDDYLLPGDLPGLARICLLMLALYAASAGLTYVQAYVMAGVAQRTVRDLRADLFDHLQTLPLRFFDQRARGDIMSRLTNDLDNVSTVLSENLMHLISGVLTLVGAAAAMIWIEPRLAAVSLTLQPLIMLSMTRWIGKRTRAGFRAQQATLGKLNGLIEETVTGQRVVKAYGREPAALADFDTANRDFRAAAIRAQTFAGFMGPLMNFVNNLGLAIVVGVGGWMAVNGQTTVGTIAAFISYSRQFGRPLNEIANLYNAIQGAVAGAERVFAVLDEAPETPGSPSPSSAPAPASPSPSSAPTPGSPSPSSAPAPASPNWGSAIPGQTAKRIRGEVAFEGVSFGYDPANPVLRDVSLHARPGETVALVGPTGAGKTTIVNLLTRFYDVDQGRILIDGCDLREYSRDDLRRQLGIVLQDMFLFADAVLENIRYGRLDASDAEVMAAARLANADQFIHRLPHGYATVLAERGGNLSQGQRQLLSIARAILADPSILILDEATSSVDTRTEQHIQEAMLRLMAGRTSFVIAHRLSTIRNADQILVIDHGQVVERGTHGELLAQHGFYHHLYTSQFRVGAAQPPAITQRSQSAHEPTHQSSPA